MFISSFVSKIQAHLGVGSSHVSLATPFANLWFRLSIKVVTTSCSSQCIEKAGIFGHTKIHFSHRMYEWSEWDFERSI